MVAGYRFKPMPRSRSLLASHYPGQGSKEATTQAFRPLGLTSDEHPRSFIEALLVPLPGKSSDLA
jgi:hypothetical protein